MQCCLVVWSRGAPLVWNFGRPERLLGVKPSLLNSSLANWPRYLVVVGGGGKGAGQDRRGAG